MNQSYEVAIRESFSNMDDEHLLERKQRGGLTDEASVWLDEEINKRNMSAEEIQRFNTLRHSDVRSNAASRNNPSVEKLKNEVYAKFETEKLLSMRAQGDVYSSEAREILDEILVERLGSVPVSARYKNAIKWTGMIIVIIISLAIVQNLKQSKFGLPLAVIIGVIYFFSFIKKTKRTDAENKEHSLKEKISDEGLSELIVVSAEGSLDKVKELVELGYNINRKSNNDSTAIMFAAKNNHLDVAKYLIANGANPSQKNTNGSSAISLAKKNNYEEMLKILGSQ
jgi:ankyrin repeat protein